MVQWWHVAVVASLALPSGCGGTKPELPHAMPTPTAPAVRFLAADEWPAGSRGGTWISATAFDPDPDGESWEGAELPLLCLGSVFTRDEVRAQAWAIHGDRDELDDHPGPGRARADQYVTQYADPATATTRARAVERQIRDCLLGLRITPLDRVAPNVGGEVVIFSAVRPKRSGGLLYAVGRRDGFVQVVSLDVSDPIGPAVLTAFNNTVSTAMSRLTISPPGSP
jgi:hypothetical protein